MKLLMTFNLRMKPPKPTPWWRDLADHWLIVGLAVADVVSLALLWQALSKF